MLKRVIFSACLIVMNSAPLSWSDNTPELTAQQLREQLSKAIDQKNLAQVKQLIAQGAPLNIPTQAEVTNASHADSYNHLLRSAIFVDSLPILQYLLDHGAELETQLPYSSFSGMSLPNILIRAMHSKSADATAMVKVLLQAGANPNLIGNGDCAEDDIPLLNALDTDNYQVAQLLLSYGADPNVNTPNHDSPLWNAVETKHVKAVTLLINAGANVNLPREDSLVQDFCNDDSGLLLDLAQNQLGEEAAQIKELLLAAGAYSIKDYCPKAGIE